MNGFHQRPEKVTCINRAQLLFEILASGTSLLEWEFEFQFQKLGPIYTRDLVRGPMKHKKRQSNTGALYLVRWDRWCVREGRTRYTTMRRRDDDGWCEETKTTTRASECCGDGGSGGKG